MQSRPLKLGVLGTGNIAIAQVGYLPNLRMMHEKVEVVAVADTVFERAQAAARDYGIPQAYASLDDMLAQADIEAVLNITSIPFHYATSLRILEAGKHCISEKPLATTLEEADALVEAANARNLTFVCAPMLAVLPTHVHVRRLLREGAIGRVAFARVRSSHGGPAAGPFPTDPTWFYQKGAGPLFDMGVYGIHDITNYLGPAKRVSAMSGITEPVRTVAAGPYEGKQIHVTEDDNTLLMLDFGESTFAFIDGTYNVNATKSPRIEIFGRAGTISINDYAAVRAGAPQYEIYRVNPTGGGGEWTAADRAAIMEEGERYDTIQRAALVDYFVDVVRGDTRNVLTAEHARHVLEIMLVARESARTGRTLDLATTF
jgi:predicted dehydrogenase